MHKMRSDAMRKNGNFTSEPCDKADDAKCSFRKGAINEKYTFFQWILQISACNKMVRKGHIQAYLEGPREICFMNLLLCRFQNHASHRGWGVFSHKMRPDAMRKYRKFTLKPCDKADDAKCSLPERAVNEKYTFLQWILQISSCNKWCKKGAYRHNWRA